MICDNLALCWATFHCMCGSKVDKNRYARESPPSGRIRIWQGCAASVARAVWSLQREHASLPVNTRYRALPKLVRLYVDPALRKAMKVAGYDTQLLDFILGSGGIAGALPQPAELDRNLCRLAHSTGDAMTNTVDTLREVVHWVAGQHPVRQTQTQIDQVDQRRCLRRPAKRPVAERRKNKFVVTFSAYRTWPYCEYCGDACERAALLREPDGLTDPKAASPRFCKLHNISNPSGHRAGVRINERFKLILHAIYDEIREDRSFAARFREQTFNRRYKIDRLKTFSGDPVALEDRMDELARDWSLITQEESIQISKCIDHRLLTDPLQTLARNYAFHIARRLPDEVTLKVVRALAAGKTKAAIASNLGLTLRKVGYRVDRYSDNGYFDFSRHSHLLYWWPDDAVAGPAAFRLTRSEDGATMIVRKAEELSHEAHDLVGHQAPARCDVFAGSTPDAMGREVGAA